MINRRSFLASSAALAGAAAFLPHEVSAVSAEAAFGKKPLAFLKELLSNPSPSGYEMPVQKIWSDYTKKFAKVSSDTMGNTISLVNGKGAPRYMLAGHCDEIGFMVKYIDGDGYIYFAAMGGFDQSIIPGRRVNIHTKNGPIPGVIGKGPIHLMSQSARNSGSKITDLCIDIGASSKTDAESVVALGDPVTYTYEFMEMRNGIAVARGFDDRAGIFIVAEALRVLAESKTLEASVYGVSTVQEEIGLRGAVTSAFGIEPDVALATDVTHATDYPGMSKSQSGDIRLGGGAVITRGPNINHKVFDLLVETAEKNDIKYQVLPIPGGTGTDARVIQLSRAGVPTGLISIPLRYMHTPVETLDVEDIMSIIKLMVAFGEALKPGMDFTI